MSSRSILRLFVENRAEEMIANGIFADYVRDGRLEVRMCWTSSSAISFAELTLLREAATPVTLVLNCASDPQEFRKPIERILSRAAGHERWHVALAIPEMTAWLLKDPQFAEFLNKSSLQTRPAKVDVAVHFEEWSKHTDNRFDRDELSRRDAEFEALNRFVDQHVAAFAPA